MGWKFEVDGALSLLILSTWLGKGRRRWGGGLKEVQVPEKGVSRLAVFLISKVIPISLESRRSKYIKVSHLPLLFVRHRFIAGYVATNNFHLHSSMSPKGCPFDVLTAPRRRRGIDPKNKIDPHHDPQRVHGRKFESSIR